MLKLSIIILTATTLIFGWRRTLSYLRYNNTRFWNWIKENRAFDSRGSMAFLAVAIGALLFPTLSPLLALLALTVLWVVAYQVEGDPRTTGKIRLNMTDRAKKTAWVAYAMLATSAAIPLMWLGCSCTCSSGNKGSQPD